MFVPVVVVVVVTILCCPLFFDSSCDELCVTLVNMVYRVAQKTDHLQKSVTRVYDDTKGRSYIRIFSTFLE